VVAVLITANNEIGVDVRYTVTVALDRSGSSALASDQQQHAPSKM
jgi:hypothetical protein